jgi:uridine phosphorylase
MEPKLSDKAIVRPVKNSRTPRLGPVAALVGTKMDFEGVRRRVATPTTRHSALFAGHLLITDANQGQFAVAGPLMGAPAAVMFLETLVAWGARKLLYFGWCGAIAPHIHSGDIIVPTGAVIDEGTSLHYHADLNQVAASSPEIRTAIRQTLRAHAQPFHEGLVWTTDALFRETPAKVAFYQQQGALGVEMETSALFTAANFYHVAMGCILVVSDELSTMTWQPGFKDERFKRSRIVIGDLIPLICKTLSPEILE